MKDKLIELLIEGHKQYLFYDQIADYLLENGVVVPPVKVGDVVYTNINGIGLQNSFMVNHVDLLGFSNGLYSWTWHQLGKSVFVTLEQAEKALAEVANGKQN